MAEAEILRVTEKINSFLIEKANDVEGYIMEKVERVMNELRLILDFIADKKLEEGSRLKYWISDVVEIAHDAHLLIHNTEPWCYFELSLPLKPICRSLRETRKRILELGAEGGSKSPIPSWSLRDDVVGLEQDVESMLREWILYEVRGLSTMCIVGMAGIGKTTLARKVYDHASVVDRYECRAWVCVAGKWSNKEVLMKLILEVVENEKDRSVLMAEMENADNGSLQQMLYQHLRGKPFLIVLDNIGEIPYSRSIFKALPNEDEESRLLITSRFRSIKYRVLRYAHVSTFKMKPLDDDRSWYLFVKLLLVGNQEFPKKLVKKGKEMLRSCAGLPLSIKEVATQFVVKRHGGSEWEELLESVDLSLTLAVLALSYYGLPPQLKSCFLCLRFFEIGIPTRREKLVQVWTAGQVIPHQQEDEDQDLEGEVKLCMDSSMMNLRPTYGDVPDLLEGYKTTLMKLIDESIIEVDTSNKNHRIKCIRINASFHTLSVAKAKEEMVFETIKKDESNPPSYPRPCHRAIYCSRNEFNYFTDHDKLLVSLFFRGGGYFEVSEPHWKRFEKLRTLDFDGFGLKMLSETIGELTELRYLGLRDNYILELPRSLERLKNLEVLDIALNFMIEVPDIIWKISSLRHLYMSDIICRKPLKIDTLENLETLIYISIDNWTFDVSSLKIMTSLRKLGIEEVDENSDVCQLFASIVNLKSLDCLILRGFYLRSLPSLHGLETLNHLREIRLDGLIRKLPSAGTFPPRISHLSLINSSLDEDPMHELGKLDSLVYLKLKNAYTGQQMVIPPERCLSLEVLCIEELWHLRSIQVENYTHTFGLVKLEIKSCPYLENIPEHIITNRMKEMKMTTTRKLAAQIRKSNVISNIKHVDIQP